MKKRKILMGVILASIAIISSCSEKISTITHVARVQLEQGRYSVFIDALDAEMMRMGLSRYGAAPGLNVIKGRDVLYANYRFHLSDKSWFLSADDVQKSGVIELRVYSTVIEDEQARHQAIVRLSSVLTTFGAKLTLRTEAPKN